MNANADILVTYHNFLSPSKLRVWGAITGASEPKPHVGAAKPMHDNHSQMLEPAQLIYMTMLKI